MHVVIAEPPAEAVAAIVEGPLTRMCPGAALHLRPDATVIVDEAAAGGLTPADHYRDTYQYLPEWQRFEMW